jgi:ASC-1-like (ASCH) protein
MHLHPGPFEKVKSGAKHIEVRLNDDKRKLLKVGDTITFTNRENGKTLFVAISLLIVFPSLKEFLESNSSEVCGYETPAKLTEEFLKYYTPDQEVEHGIVGIKFNIV